MYIEILHCPLKDLLTSPSPKSQSKIQGKSMVQIEAPSTPECQKGVTSPGGLQAEDHAMFKVNIIKERL